MAAALLRSLFASALTQHDMYLPACTVLEGPGFLLHVAEA